MSSRSHFLIGIWTGTNQSIKASDNLKCWLLSSVLSRWQRQSKNHSWILIHRLLMWRQSTAVLHNKDSVLVPSVVLAAAGLPHIRPPTAYQRPHASVRHRRLLSQIFHIDSFIHSLNIHRFRTFPTIISRQWKSKDAPHIYIITHIDPLF